MKHYRARDDDDGDSDVTLTSASIVIHHPSFVTHIRFLFAMESGMNRDDSCVMTSVANIECDTLLRDVIILIDNETIESRRVGNNDDAI